MRLCAEIKTYIGHVTFVNFMFGGFRSRKAATPNHSFHEGKENGKMLDNGQTEIGDFSAT